MNDYISVKSVECVFYSYFIYIYIYIYTYIYSIYGVCITWMITSVSNPLSTYSTLTHMSVKSVECVFHTYLYMRQIFRVCILYILIYASNLLSMTACLWLSVIQIWRRHITRHLRKHVRCLIVIRHFPQKTQCDTDLAKTHKKTPNKTRKMSSRHTSLSTKEPHE